MMRVIYDAMNGNYFSLFDVVEKVEKLISMSGLDGCSDDWNGN